MSSSFMQRSILKMSQNLSRGDGKSVSIKSSPSKSKLHDVIKKEIEAKQIKQYLGLDQQDQNEYDIFIQDILESDISENWIKIYNPKQGYIYTHKTTKKQQKEHPNLENFRQILYELIQNINQAKNITVKDPQLQQNNNASTNDPQNTLIQNTSNQNTSQLTSSLSPTKKPSLFTSQILNPINSSQRQQKQSQIQQRRSVFLQKSTILQLKSTQKPQQNIQQQSNSNSNKSFLHRRSILQPSTSLTNQQNNNNQLQPYQNLFQGSSQTRVLLNILRHSHMDQILENQDHCLQNIETELQHASLYYRIKYGEEMLRVPQAFEQQEIFQNTNFGPYEIARNLQILNISQKEPYLFFYGKIYEQIDLPPLWQKKFDPTQKQDFYLYQNTEFLVHPCYFYLRQNIENFRQNKNDIIATDISYYYRFRNMRFVDELQRIYDIDMSYLLLELQILYSDSNQQFSQDQINKFKNQERKKKLEQQSRKEELMNDIEECEDENKREILVKQLKDLLLVIENQEIDKQNIENEQQQPHEGDQKLLSRPKEPIALQGNVLQQSIQDVVILSIFKQLKADIGDIYVYETVLNFLQKQKKQSSFWYYIITENSQVVWINSINQRSQPEYPQLKLLQKQIDLIRQAKIKEMSKKNTVYKEIFSEFDITSNMIEELDKEKIKYTKFMLEKKITEEKQKGSYQKLPKNEEPEEENNKYDFTRIQEILGLNSGDMNSHELINLVFYCPYNLQKNVINSETNEKGKLSWKQNQNIIDIIMEEIRKQAKFKDNEKRKDQLKKFIETQVNKQNEKRKKIQSKFMETVDEIVKSKPKYLARQLKNTKKKSKKSKKKEITISGTKISTFRGNQSTIVGFASSPLKPKTKSSSKSNPKSNPHQQSFLRQQTVEDILLQNRSKFRRGSFKSKNSNNESLNILNQQRERAKSLTLASESEESSESDSDGSMDLKIQNLNNQLQQSLFVGDFNKSQFILGQIKDKKKENDQKVNDSISLLQSPTKKNNKVKEVLLNLKQDKNPERKKSMLSWLKSSVTLSPTKKSNSNSEANNSKGKIRKKKKSRKRQNLQQNENLKPNLLKLQSMVEERNKEMEKQKKEKQILNKLSIFSNKKQHLNKSQTLQHQQLDNIQENTDDSDSLFDQSSELLGNSEMLQQSNRNSEDFDDDDDDDEEEFDIFRGKATKQKKKQDNWLKGKTFTDSQLMELSPIKNLSPIKKKQTSDLNTQSSILGSNVLKLRKIYSSKNQNPEDQDENSQNFPQDTSPILKNQLPIASKSQIMFPNLLKLQKELQIQKQLKEAGFQVDISKSLKYLKNFHSKISRIIELRKKAQITVNQQNKLNSVKNFHNAQQIYIDELKKSYTDDMQNQLLNNSNTNSSSSFNSSLQSQKQEDNNNQNKIIEGKINSQEIQKLTKQVQFIGPSSSNKKDLNLNQNQTNLQQQQIYKTLLNNHQNHYTQGDWTNPESQPLLVQNSLKRLLPSKDQQQQQLQQISEQNSQEQQSQQQQQNFATLQEQLDKLQQKHQAQKSSIAQFKQMQRSKSQQQNQNQNKLKLQYNESNIEIEIKKQSQQTPQKLLQNQNQNQYSISHIKEKETDQTLLENYKNKFTVCSYKAKSRSLTSHKQHFNLHKETILQQQNELQMQYLENQQSNSSLLPPQKNIHNHSQSKTKQKINKLYDNKLLQKVLLKKQPQKKSQSNLINNNNIESQKSLKHNDQQQNQYQQQNAHHIRYQFQQNLSNLQLKHSQKKLQSISQQHQLDQFIKNSQKNQLPSLKQNTLQFNNDQKSGSKSQSRTQTSFQKYKNASDSKNNYYRNISNQKNQKQENTNISIQSKQQRINRSQTHQNIKKQII